MNDQKFQSPESISLSYHRGALFSIAHAVPVSSPSSPTQPTSTTAHSPGEHRAPPPGERPGSALQVTEGNPPWVFCRSERKGPIGHRVDRGEGSEKNWTPIFGLNPTETTNRDTESISMASVKLW